LARFDAFSGLILVFEAEAPALTWVARLQFPFFHFDAGSGHAAQYHAVEYSADRAQPSHWSTVVWQTPPLKEQPLAVMKRQSVPFFIVVQFIGITPFLKI